MAHLIISIICLILVAISLCAKRDPNKWYGDMLCVRCAYRWISRKSNPPARCPKCGGQRLHAVTINKPAPERQLSVIPDYRRHELVYARQRRPIAVKVEPRPMPECRPHEKQLENHRKLEQILHFDGATLEEKAYFLVAFTRNADPTNLMHRLKIDETMALELLQRLEAAAHVSAPDELGERLVLAPEPQ